MVQKNEFAQNTQQHRIHPIKNEKQQQEKYKKRAITMHF